MNRHAAADNDEANCQSHHELVEEIAQLKEREQVLVSENDQLRAQLVEMKEEAHKKYDDLMVQYNMKREYEDDGTSNNQVTVKTEWDHEEVKVEIKEEIKEGEEDHDIFIKREYVTEYIKTESNDVKVEIKEEIKEGEEDHDIFIKREYVTEYIKTESNDVKIEIKEEIKEEEDEDDHKDDCGYNLRLVKKEEVSDDDDNSMQLDDPVNVDEVMQHNLSQPIDILSRDQLNTPTNFELSPSANCQMQLTNSSQIEQSVDQQVDKADHEPNEPDNHGHNQWPTTKLAKTRKRKSLTNEGSSLENSSTSSQVSTPGLKKRSKRVSKDLDRTETVQEVSTVVAVDEREMDEQNGGGGLGQIEDDDDETELGEEDEGGHYKIEIAKLKCTEDSCEDEVASRDELNDHLRVKHHISPYRCLAEGCNERFEQWTELGRHVQDNHSNISTWSCAHCTKTFKTHGRLYLHLHYYHFEGQFKCGYDGCHYDRVATLRIEIQNHQLSVHRKITIFTCPFHNCGKSFNHKGTFNRHQLIHQNVKPFKCTWNMCDYATTQQGHVITHIRTQHFHLPASQKKQRELGIEDNRNPRDYLQQEHDNSPN